MVSRMAAGDCGMRDHAVGQRIVRLHSTEAMLLEFSSGIA